MPERDADAIAYLRIPADAAWRWADRGETVIWNDGTTIAFREELQHILAWLSPHGLPPFPAVVMLLAACRGKIPARIPQQSSLHLTLLVDHPGTTAAFVSHLIERQFQQTVYEVKKILAIPQGHVSRKEAKAVLAEVVFAAANPACRVDGEAVLEYLRSSRLDEEDLNQPGRTHHTATDLVGLQLVAAGLKGYTSSRLELRIRTGLDELPDPAAVPLPPALRLRRLLEKLREDPEHAPLARAIRDILASLYLPRRIEERDEVPTGGLADLAQRGSLDRLLLSELAHDDLTLAVRVALNESLYYRREPPMDAPPGGLAILVDGGIRMWGVPRLLATAAALALIAREGKRQQAITFRAGAGGAAPIDLLTRGGLVDHLGRLETNPHPGPALGGFAAALKSIGRGPAVIITHHDALGDKEFRRGLTSFTGRDLYLAAVDCTGRFQLFDYPRLKAPICQAGIAIDGLFPGKAVVPFTVHQPHPGLPAILSARPFPFLLPVAYGIETHIRIPRERIVAATRERSLILLEGSDRGARLLVPFLPGGLTLALHHHEGTVYTVQGHLPCRPDTIVQFDLGGTTAQRVSLQETISAIALYLEAGNLGAIQSKTVSIFDLRTGGYLETLRVPNGVCWRHGRYFQDSNQWHLLSWKLIVPALIPCPNILPTALLYFDREGLEGPWALTAEGKVWSLAGGADLWYESGLDLSHTDLRVSEDGHSIHVWWRNTTRAGFLDLKQRRFSYTFQGTPPWVDQIVLPQCPLHRDIDAIDAAPGEPLRLRRRDGAWLELKLERNQLISLDPCKPPDAPGRVRCFQPCALPEEIGLTLLEARWESGSSAWFDSRGLLHLKSADPLLPEVSLVLARDAAAAWSSDGRLSGPRYFIGDARSVSPELQFRKVRDIIDRLP